MYGFWRLGLSPAPSAGGVCSVKGLATPTSSHAKKTATPASTGTVHAIASRVARRFVRTASAPYPVSTSSQSSSDPSWPPQKAEIVYAVGRSRLVCWATYSNVKSCRTSAATRTEAATSVEKNDATSAFCADSASRRRRVAAAYEPATSA
jgi:hypothetical protein